jgi:hypothetical protein
MTILLPEHKRTFHVFIPGLRLSSGSSQDTSKSSKHPSDRLRICNQYRMSILKLFQKSGKEDREEQTSPTTASFSTGFNEHVE